MPAPYSVIYTDPPWKFRTWSETNQAKSPSRHYDLMEAGDIRAIPVKDWCEKDCALFMWVVQSNLPEALALIDAWGFKFKTVAFAWVKMKGKQDRLFYTGDDVRMGLGYHTRSGFEQCWLATRGDGYKRLVKNEPQVVFSPLREHSRKPDEIADAIVRLVGDVPRLEMFARTQRDGWDTTGNEIDKFSPPPGPLLAAMGGT